MKTSILSIALLLAFSPVFGQEGKQDKKAEKKAKQEALAATIKAAVEAKNYTILMNSALPMRGRSINLTSSYDFTVRGDSAIAYLPYFGVAYRADYGSTEGGIKFAEPVKNYKVDFKQKKGYMISFEVTSPKDSYQVRVNIGLSGYASVDITPTNSDFISYNGEMQAPQASKEAL